MLSAALVFLVGLGISLLLPRRFAVPWRRSAFLYLWHTAFCVIYLIYSLSNSADSVTYYQESLAYSGGSSSGTEFLYSFTNLLTEGLGFSYLGVFLVFNIFGFIGLLSFYGAIREAVKFKSAAMSRLGFLFVLLPSASFWSAALGKDAIAFMAACLFLWAVLDLRHRLFWMALALVAISLVRLHIAAIMVTSISIGVMVLPGLSRVARMMLGVAGVLGAFVIIPAAMQYAGVGSGASADIADYVQLRQSYNQDAGSGVDISDMSFPMQLATYIYRPLPFEAHNATSMAASLENVFILLLSGSALIVLVRSKKRVLALRQLTLWLYFLCTWAVLAVTTANLGIAVRQKWMFLPILLYLIAAVLGRRKDRNQLQGLRGA
jgi:hypothetical protein